MRYSADIASTGHSSSHVPQSVHFSASISKASSPSLIASSGQTSAHAPHEMHSSASITRGIVSSQSVVLTVNGFAEIVAYFWLLVKVGFSENVLYVRQLCPGAAHRRGSSARLPARCIGAAESACEHWLGLAGRRSAVAPGMSTILSGALCVLTALQRAGTLECIACFSRWGLGHDAIMERGDRSQSLNR